MGVGLAVVLSDRLLRAATAALWANNTIAMAGAPLLSLTAGFLRAGVLFIRQSWADLNLRNLIDFISFSLSKGRHPHQEINNGGESPGSTLQLALFYIMNACTSRNVASIPPNAGSDPCHARFNSKN